MTGCGGDGDISDSESCNDTAAVGDNEDIAIGSQSHFSFDGEVDSVVPDVGQGIDIGLVKVSVHLDVVHGTFVAIHDGSRHDESGSWDDDGLKVNGQTNKLRAGASSKDDRIRTVIAQGGGSKDRFTSKVDVSCESSRDRSSTGESLVVPSAERATGDTPVGTLSFVGNDRRGFGLEIDLFLAKFKEANVGRIPAGSSKCTRELESIYESIDDGSVGRLGGLRPHEEVVLVVLAFTDNRARNNGIIVSIDGSVKDSRRSKGTVIIGRVGVENHTSGVSFQYGKVSDTGVGCSIVFVVGQEDVSAIAGDEGVALRNAVQGIRDPKFISVHVQGDDTAAKSIQEGEATRRR